MGILGQQQQQQQQQKAAAGSSGSNGGPVLPTGVDVSGALGVVRGRVLPSPHLAYATPECAYPGTQVCSGCCGILLMPSPACNQHVGD